MTSSERDVGRFNRWAATYDRHYLQRRVFEPVQKALLEVAVSEAPGAKAILDVGCGTGRLLRSAESLFPDARLEGVDAAPEMVATAKAAPGADSRITVQHASAEALPFGDAEFDLVFSTMTFHHWADQRRGAAEVGRVLGADGRWLLADFVVSGFLRLFMSQRFPRRPGLDRMFGDVGLGVRSQRRVAGLGRQVPILVIGRR